ncbi:MAG TPA: carbohydrate-binding family 9-like protein [bacterium]|nr:carbohydrate-binding family 9-like protein [bacterium]HOM26338.1 carbohydrate-binding family 9-like protein [bacterium]
MKNDFEIIAKYTDKPLIIDGKLQEDVWKKAPIYELELPGNEKKQPVEKGEVQLAWDEEYLYVGIKFYDSDIVQESNKNQTHHYLTGDLVEIFLKPEKNTWYWEIYGTPNCKKTVFFFPGRGRAGLQGCFKPNIDLDRILIGTQIKGTLNNWHDIDEYWTLEMAIPSEELKSFGDNFGYGSEWRILIARYNYSRYLHWKELSSFPKLSVPNFHLIEEYGKLVFEK